MTTPVRVKCDRRGCVSFGKRISATSHQHTFKQTQPLTPRERMQRYAAQNDAGMKTLGSSFRSASGLTTTYALTLRQAQQIFRQTKRSSGYVAYREGGGVQVREI